MNDRFRFRLWDDKLKTYFHSNDDGSLQFDIEKVLDGLTVHEGEVLEQCTGLKDKNGKLIYENDYVKIGDEIFRVFWNSTKISLENMLKNDIIDMQEKHIMEIVGNAHEERDIREVQKNS